MYLAYCAAQADVLERAANVIKYSGHTKHKFYDSDTGGYCMAGAVLEVYDAEWRALGRSSQGVGDLHSFHPIWRPILHVLEHGDCIDEAVFAHISAFNDGPSTTADEVIAELRQAAAMLRGQS